MRLHRGRAPQSPARNRGSTLSTFVALTKSGSAASNGIKTVAQFNPEFLAFRRGEFLHQRVAAGVGEVGLHFVLQGSMTEWAQALAQGGQGAFARGAAELFAKAYRSVSS